MPKQWGGMVRVRIKSSSDIFAARGNPWSDIARTTGVAYPDPTPREVEIAKLLDKAGLPAVISSAEKRFKFRTEDDVELDALFRATRSSGKNPDAYLTVKAPKHHSISDSRKIMNIAIKLGRQLRGK